MSNVCQRSVLGGYEQSCESMKLVVEGRIWLHHVTAVKCWTEGLQSYPSAAMTRCRRIFSNDCSKTDLEKLKPNHRWGLEYCLHVGQTHSHQQLRVAMGIGLEVLDNLPAMGSR